MKQETHWLFNAIMDGLYYSIFWLSVAYLLLKFKQWIWKLLKR